MDLTIIIVNHNSKNLLINCLESIKNSLKINLLKHEIIVIDNASTDGSLDYLKKNRKINLIINRINKGFGSACNQGIVEAKGKYILLLNPDILVLKDAIYKLVAFFKKFDKGFVGAKLLNPNLTVQASCGLFPNLPVVILMLFLQGERLNITKFSPQKITKVDWVSGACLLGKKEDFLKLGGFDENIFLYMEEVDLLYRAKKIGLPNYFYNEAEFIHIGAAISGHKQAVNNIFQGLLYFYKRHYSYFDCLILKLLLYLKSIIAISLGTLILKKQLVSQYKLTIQNINRIN